MKLLIYIVSFVTINFTFSQSFESFYGKILHSRIKLVENNLLIEAETMYIKINKDYIEVSVRSEIKKEFCAEIVYPTPIKLVYTKNRNSIIIENSIQERNNKFKLVSLTLRKEKVYGKVEIENKIEEFEFK